MHLNPDKGLPQIKSVQMYISIKHFQKVSKKNKICFNWILHSRVLTNLKLSSKCNGDDTR